MSEVWKYFEKVGMFPDLRSKCKICSATLKYSSSTGAMWNHLKLKHPTSAATEGKDQTAQPGPSQSTMQKYLVPQRSCDEARQKKLTALILEIFFKDMLPIKFIESPSFKKLLGFMEPNYKIPSRRAITALLEKQYNDTRKDLQHQLISKDIRSISITTDSWSSLNMESFITITAHFINVRTWALRSAVLATCAMEETYTAANLRQKLESILEEYQIGEKTFMCVHDNAANINLAIEKSNYFRHHIGCAAHTLQLCVNSGLQIQRIQKAVAAASRLVGHFKRSCKATNALKQKQINMNLPQHKLVQSVATRWNSTYDMCERLTEQRWAVVAALSDKEVTKISDARVLELKEEDWTLISELCETLKPLKTATETFSMEKDVSVSIVSPVIRALLNKHLLANENGEDSTQIAEFKKLVAEDIKKRFHCYLDFKDNTNTMLIATFLDPRHKHLPFIKDKNIKEKIYSDLRTQLQLLNDNETTRLLGPEFKKSKRSSFLGEGYNNAGQPGTGENSDEVNLYLSLPIADVDACALLWWKVNCSVLPNLSKIASDYLSVPASSVPSERMFSSAGRLLNKLRCSLSSKHVDQILFLNRNTRDENDA